VFCFEFETEYLLTFLFEIKTLKLSTSQSHWFSFKGSNSSWIWWNRISNFRKDRWRNWSCCL
jgi:hypothetical protein